MKFSQLSPYSQMYARQLRGTFVPLGLSSSCWGHVLHWRIGQPSWRADDPVWSLLYGHFDTLAYYLRKAVAS